MDLQAQQRRLHRTRTPHDAKSRRKLVGFEVTERGIARDHQDVLDEAGTKIGYVTSGSPAPYLKKNIGLAYVPIESAEVGSKLIIDVRGRHVAAAIVPVPFYKRDRSAS